MLKIIKISKISKKLQKYKGIEKLDQKNLIIIHNKTQTRPFFSDLDRSCISSFYIIKLNKYLKKKF